MQDKIAIVIGANSGMGLATTVPGYINAVRLSVNSDMKRRIYTNRSNHLC
jgi:NAD(P)-dependent dehydrogenase (short-subunit alcohol dehydrogenase family)